MSDATPIEQSIIDDVDSFTSLKGAEWWVILPLGRVAFRYGPYDGKTAGALLDQCVKKEIPAIITGNCGDVFDWELAEGLGACAREIEAKRAVDKGATAAPVDEGARRAEEWAGGDTQGAMARIEGGE